MDETSTSGTVIEALETLSDLDSPEAIADGLTRTCAEIAGYHTALLSVAIPAGTIQGFHGLADRDIAHFRDSSRRASLQERRTNRRRIRDRSFPGTGIAYIRRATDSFHVHSTENAKTERPGAWRADDALFVLVVGEGGEDIGVLSLDRPTSGMGPTDEAGLDTLRIVERLLRLAVPLLESRFYRRRLESAERMVAQLQKNDVLGVLAMEVAHDFNNLLMVIMGHAYRARVAESAEETVTAIDQIDATCERGAELTGKLLAFGRKNPTSPGRLDLNAVVESSVPMLRQAAGADVRVELSLCGSALPIRGRASDIDQILLNLVVNAREAMDGQGQVVVQTSTLEEHGTHFGNLRVSDTGCGFDAPPDQIFEPYYTTKPGNTGLGLATVERLVRTLGGRIRLKDGKPRGATVEIQIPLEAVDAG